MEEVPSDLREALRSIIRTFTAAMGATVNGGQEVCTYGQTSSMTCNSMLNLPNPLGQTQGTETFTPLP